MADGIYTSLAGALSSERRIEAISSNIANASTPGFMPERFFAHADPQPAAGDGATLPRAASQIDLSSGPLEKTGAPLDVAPANGAFLVVETPNGERLTRAGSLHQDAEGVLVSDAGYPVLSDRGTLRSPLPMSITPEGLVSADSVELGQLRLMQVVDPAGVTREGANLLAFEPEAAVDVVEPVLTVGALNRTPLSAIDSLVDVIVATRAFEAYQQSIKAQDEAERKSTNLGKI